MISGANIMRKFKKRRKSEEKSKEGRSKKRCEYDKIKGCETSRPDSPRWVTTWKTSLKQSMNRIDVIISKSLILKPSFTHQLDSEWLTLLAVNYLILAIDSILSEIDVMIR